MDKQNATNERRSSKTVPASVQNDNPPKEVSHAKHKTTLEEKQDTNENSCDEEKANLRAHDGKAYSSKDTSGISTGQNDGDQQCTTTGTSKVSILHQQHCRPHPVVTTSSTHRSSFRYHRQASSELVVSIKELMDRMDEILGEHSSRDDGRRWIARWRPWESWTLYRSRSTAVGCLSSVTILIVRLLLDSEPLAYLIHSIVIFLDMILIHFFTNCLWLSVTGELVALVCFLAFHFTKETLYELLETTLIAMLCSFHLIGSRNKHMRREESLTQQVQSVTHTSMHLLRQTRHIDWEELAAWEAQQQQQQQPSNNNVDSNKPCTITPQPMDGTSTSFLGLDPKQKERVRGCGAQFFEHFLDGSAGVMYTSFLGLILTEIITYGEKKASKCG